MLIISKFNGLNHFKRKTAKVGNICSSSVAKKVVAALGQSLLNKLGLNFSIEEWIKAHNSGTVEENTTELETYCTDLSKCDVLPTSLNNAALICCNMYTRPDYSLGVGPMNDSITVASYMKSIGFTVYFAHNPTSVDFLKYYKHFIQNTQKYLVIYYTCHGGSMKDTNADDADDLDEALVFDDAILVDEKRLEALKSSNKPNNSKIMFLTDCCHSGSFKIYKVEAIFHQTLCLCLQQHK
ncbi:hypothetical protein M9Y10_025001 [Tritrichomonas musculus]|uniref:Peptidase C14 caspase domain-containing protein n=2 Tax=Tritrichomonas musculus TaxID=1915356 RepID=A0ABR2GLJ5_9EUKA